MKKTDSSQTPSSVPEAQPTDSSVKGLGVVGVTLLPTGAMLVAQGKQTRKAVEDLAQLSS
jgi:hypothetical protein